MIETPFTPTVTASGSPAYYKHEVDECIAQLEAENEALKASIRRLMEIDALLTEESDD